MRTDVVEHVAGKAEVHGELHDHLAVRSVLAVASGAEEVAQARHEALQADERAVLHVVRVDPHDSHEVVAHAGARL